MMFALHRLAADDAEMIAALRAGGLPVNDLSSTGQSLFAFTHADRRVGHGGFLLAQRDVLIRSVIVDADERKTGVGGALVAALLDEARKAGARDAWLLTTDAAPFFERAGFVSTPRDRAPAAIANTPQFRGLCPASATFMHRDLSRRP